MALLLATAVAVVFWTTLWVPVIRRAYWEGEARRAEQFFLTKLRLVRKFYPQLHDLTYTEIAEQYDVEELYDNIGTRPYHLT